MAKEGYNVVVANINTTTAAEVVKEITDESNAAIAVFMNITSEASVEAGFNTIMAAYGSCDLVMPNAAI